MPKHKLKYQDRDVTGQSVGFTNEEPWSQYVLEDGTLVKVKIVMMDVMRLDNEYDPNGFPIYLINAQQVVGIIPNPELKQKVN